MRVIRIALAVVLVFVAGRCFAQQQDPNAQPQQQQAQGQGQGRGQRQMSPMQLAEQQTAGSATNGAARPARAGKDVAARVAPRRRNRRMTPTSTPTSIRPTFSR